MQPLASLSQEAHATFGLPPSGSMFNLWPPSPSANIRTNKCDGSNSMTQNILGDKTVMAFMIFFYFCYGYIKSISMTLQFGMAYI